MSSKVNYQSSQAKTSDEHITKPACKEQLTSGMARCSSNYWNRCTQIMLGPKEEQDAQGMLQVKPMIARYRLNLCNAYQGNSGPSKKPTQNTPPHKTLTMLSATSYLQKQQIPYSAFPQLLLNKIQDTPLLFAFFHLLFSTGNR